MVNESDAEAGARDEDGDTDAVLTAFLERVALLERELEELRAELSTVARDLKANRRKPGASR